jgi:hypothetical protein
MQPQFALDDLLLMVTDDVIFYITKPNVFLQEPEYMGHVTTFSAETSSGAINIT